jgi:hypothetical protein
MSSRTVDLVGTLRRMGWIAALAATGCLSSGAVRRHPGRPTGTCGGACAYYLDCKGQASDDGVFRACVDECRAIYEDPFMLASYERLRCEDAISFIEGASGRGPGWTSQR